MRFHAAPRFAKTGAGLLLGALTLLGCRSKASRSSVAASASAQPSALPVDHLAEGELQPGKTEVFGFPVPVGMELESRFADRAYLHARRITPEELANYVRQHVTVSHVEIAAARTVFPNARINANTSGRVFALEVVPAGSGTRLIIKDATPPPPPPPGLSEAERWRAAGMSPDGRPLDMKKLE
ncbi:MAG TPA: hypothetical protein VJN18_16670 [Polyangiaceae bacterium]|nr:hypothetical protein [Polyangiaceae bacterium]